MRWRLIVEFIIGLLTGSWDGFNTVRTRRQADVNKGAADEKSDQDATDEAAAQRAKAIANDLAKQSPDDLRRDAAEWLRDP